MAHPLALPRSGDEREDRAIAIAAAVAAVFGAAEYALIASIAAAVRRAVLTGTRSVTPQQFAAIVGYTLAIAEQRAQQAIEGAGVRPVPRAVMRSLESAAARAYESALSAYQEALSAAERAPSLSAFLRLQAAQRALDDLAAKGITGLTDRAGRNWDLSSYVQMATRTGISAGYAAQIAAQLQSRGLDLVLVTHGSEPICGNCAPYLGKLLSLTGQTPAGVYAIEDAAGKYRTANVAGTLAEAQAHGWNHPNCRCGAAPWEDGSDLGAYGSLTAPSPAAVAGRYAREQRQRERERNAREALRRQHAAVTPAARTRARHEIAATRSAPTRHGRRMGIPRGA